LIKKRTILLVLPTLPFVFGSALVTRAQEFSLHVNNIYKDLRKFAINGMNLARHA